MTNPYRTPGLRPTEPKPKPRRTRLLGSVENYTALVAGVVTGCTAVAVRDSSLILFPCLPTGLLALGSLFWSIEGKR